METAASARKRSLVRLPSLPIGRQVHIIVITASITNITVIIIFVITVIIIIINTIIITKMIITNIIIINVVIKTLFMSQLSKVLFSSV